MNLSSWEKTRKLDTAKINTFTVFEFLDEVVVFDLVIIRQMFLIFTLFLA
jgi:hypothetical protein